MQIIIRCDIPDVENSLTKHLPATLWVRIVTFYLVLSAIQMFKFNRAALF
jgi:hypothetical protein